MGEFAYLERIGGVEGGIENDNDVSNMDWVYGEKSFMGGYIGCEHQY